MSTSIHPADAHTARVVSHSLAADQATIDEINAGFQRFCDGSKAMSKTLIDQANEARRIGQHLTGLKRSSRGTFTSLFTVNNKGMRQVKPVLPFSHATGCTFMRFAAAHPDPIATLPDAVYSLKDLMIASGALPESGRGSQSARGSLGWLANFEKDLMNARRLLTHQSTTRGGLTGLTREELEQTEAHLRPFAEDHKRVQDALKGAA